MSSLPGWASWCLSEDLSLDSWPRLGHPGAAHRNSLLFTPYPLLLKHLVAGLLSPKVLLLWTKGGGMVLCSVGPALGDSRGTQSESLFLPLNTDTHTHHLHTLSTCHLTHTHTAYTTHTLMPCSHISLHTRDTHTTDHMCTPSTPHIPHHTYTCTHTHTKTQCIKPIIHTNTTCLHTRNVAHITHIHRHRPLCMHSHVPHTAHRHNCTLHACSHHTHAPPGVGYLGRGLLCELVQPREQVVQPQLVLSKQAAVFFWTGDFSCSEGSWQG